MHRARSGHKTKEKPSAPGDSSGDTGKAAETGRKLSPETDRGGDAQALVIPDERYNEGSRVRTGCAEMQTEGKQVYDGNKVAENVPEVAVACEVIGEANSLVVESPEGLVNNRLAEAACGAESWAECTDMPSERIEGRLEPPQFAVAHGPAGGNKGPDWQSTGARPRGRRILPPDLFSDSESDNGNEDPAFCEETSSVTPPLIHRRGDSTMVESSTVLHRERDHYACPECGRSFMSKIGLSQHRRHAHIEAYNADIDIERTKPRWTREEEYLLAAHEVRLLKEGVQNINQRLASRFPTRTFDGIKSHRRQMQYRKLVKDLLSRRDGDDQGQAVSGSSSMSLQAQEDRGAPCDNTSSRVDHRAAIVEELQTLVGKQPPRSFQAFRLWELTKRFLDGQNVATALETYLLEVFTTDRRVQRRCTPTVTQESRRKRKKREYAQCQNLYRKNRSFCIRNILDEAGSSAIEDPNAFLEEWQEILEAPPTSTHSLSNCATAGSIDPRFLITAQDIKSAMPLKNSAAGPDGFSSRSLHTCPMLVLRVLLNLLILQKRLPLFLCNARTIFIPKVPGASSAALHRPITVSHVLTRLLHKIFMRRLMSTIKLDYRQRAFLPADGCAENLLLLQTVIDEAKHKLKPLALASVDVAKAFDRVAHPAILQGLRRKGVAEGFCAYVSDFYERATTVLTCGNLSKVVHPTRGVRQGDPLSPLLFNLTLDEFFEQLPSEISFESEGFVMSAMAFADDIILMASTRNGLQSQLHRLEKHLQKCGLEANASKSATLTIMPSGRDKKAKVDTEWVYRIAGQPIKNVSHTTVWKYLGIRFDGTSANNNTVRNDLRILLARLARAPLKPQQRLVALRSYLLPRLIHRLVLGPISAKLLKALDKMVRASARTWLSLPHDVPVGFLYAPIPAGGLGIMCLRTAIPHMKVNRIERLLYSDHYQCTVAATKDFIRKALRQAHDLTQFRGTIIGSAAAVRNYWTRSLHSSCDGRPLSQCPTAPGSTAWLGEGTTFLKGKEFVDLTKFHIAAIPNLTRLKRGQNSTKRCRAGCDADESLGHILQRCHRTHHQRIQRHDAIVRYLARSLREKEWTVREEPHYQTSQGTKIPDLVLSRDGQCVILDVQIVGTRVNLSDAHEAKRTKYLVPDMLMKIKEATRATTYPTVSSVTLTYRGTWASESVGILRDVGLGREHTKIITIRCLQGGLRAFKVHQRSTAVINRLRSARAGTT